MIPTICIIVLFVLAYIGGGVSWYLFAKHNKATVTAIEDLADTKENTQ
jgi:hypothetical protein